MNNAIDNFLKKNRRATDGVLLTLSGVSGYFTYQGAVLVLDQAAMQGEFSLSAFIFSTGVTAALFLFWRYALAIVPTMNTKKTRWLGLGIVALGALFIVALSSWMNVMALAGAGAMEAHMRGSMQAHEVALQRAYTQAKAVEKLVPDLELAANRYRDLAQAEITRGALTGVAGAGGVADSLIATQKAFTDLASSIQSESNRLEQRYGEGRAAIAEMDQAVASEGSISDRRASYIAQSAIVGKVVGEMNTGDLTSVIARTVRGLSSGTGLFSVSLKNGRLAQAQQGALKRITDDLVRTGESIAKAAEKLGSAKAVAAPSFERIGLSTAVFIHAGKLVPYWAGGIGLDLMPVVLILLLMLLFYASENSQAVDPEIDDMRFGQVRKVIFALEGMRNTATTEGQEAPRLTHQETNPVEETVKPENKKGEPALLPQGLTEDEEAEWQRHLEGNAA